jgi:hypothetical protein
MKTLFVPAFLIGVMACPFAADAEPDAAQKSAICQSRSTCTIGRSYDAGTSPAGAALTVVEAHLGLKDKPDDAPDEGCRARDQFDGGIEYWLIDGTAAPRQILKLCNDGYGSAGIGEDDVEVGPNRLIHTQYGGSAWRWGSTFTFTLSPWRLASERDCSFHDAMEATGTTTDIDYLAMKSRSLAKDSPGKNNDIGCPDWPAGASERFSPAPAAGVFGAYDIIAPFLGPEGSKTRIDKGTVIGDCAPGMTTAGANGFVVYGTPAAEAQAAEVRVVAESLDTLVVQVFDPSAAGQPAPAGGSWINLPHLEIWIGRNDENLFTHLPLSQLTQIGVDLDGRVYQGAGAKQALPTVERWQASDAAGRPVVVLRLTWNDEYALLRGAALVYSQADAGKQARLVATTGIADNRPLYVSEIVTVPQRESGPQPGRCSVRDGRLSIVE